VVENVIPYYPPLIPAKKRGRHLYWTNFNLPNILSNRGNKLKEKETNSESLNHYNKFHDYDFKKYKGKQLILKIARNLVDYEAGKTIFETVCGIVRKENEKQTELF
jgi:DNA (cytosine-5)-methyltransferase 1